jgi:hypothetical protein
MIGNIGEIRGLNSQKHEGKFKKFFLLSNTYMKQNKCMTNDFYKSYHNSILLCLLQKIKILFFKIFILAMDFTGLLEEIVNLNISRLAPNQIMRLICHTSWPTYF